MYHMSTYMLKQTCDYESFEHYFSGSYEYILQHINTQTAQNEK